MDFFERHPDKPWDWYGISRNSNLTMDTVELLPDKAWDCDGISRNPNLTMDCIERHPNKPWNWSFISANVFAKEKEAFILQCYKEHIAAFRIQQYWFKAKLTPEYALCKKLVNQFYDKFIEPIYI
jgi:hypothetical protein